MMPRVAAPMPNSPPPTTRGDESSRKAPAKALPMAERMPVMRRPTRRDASTRPSSSPSLMRSPAFRATGPRPLMRFSARRTGASLVSSTTMRATMV